MDSLIQEASDDLKARQKPDGEWLFELEPDATITAEYIFLHHFLDDLEGDYAELEPKLAAFLRRIQCDHGGWALYPGGELDVAVSRVPDAFAAGTFHHFHLVDWNLL